MLQLTTDLFQFIKHHLFSVERHCVCVCMCEMHMHGHIYVYVGMYVLNCQVWNACSY